MCENRFCVHIIYSETVTVNICNMRRNFEFTHSNQNICSTRLCTKARTMQCWYACCVTSMALILRLQTIRYVHKCYFFPITSVTKTDNDKSLRPKMNFRQKSCWLANSDVPANMPWTQITNILTSQFETFDGLPLLRLLFNFFSFCTGWTHTHLAHKLISKWKSQVGIKPNEYVFVSHLHVKIHTFVV